MPSIHCLATVRKASPMLATCSQLVTWEPAGLIEWPPTGLDWRRGWLCLVVSAAAPWR